MVKWTKDFISKEKIFYRYQFGKIIASSLSGFLAGVIFTSIFWIFTLYWYEILY